MTEALKHNAGRCTGRVLFQGGLLLCAYVFSFTILADRAYAQSDEYNQAAAATEKMDDYPVVKLQSLDKGTARTMTFEARVGHTIKFGPLYIRVQACRKAPPIEQPESAAFLQIWEITKEKKPKWVFSGWMFASSPSLSAMDHPLYDVWVIDCLNQKDGQEATEETNQDKSAAATDNSGDETTAHEIDEDDEAAPAPDEQPPSSAGLAQPPAPRDIDAQDSGASAVLPNAIESEVLDGSATMPSSAPAPQQSGDMEQQSQ